MLDLNISLGNILTMIAFFLGGLGFLWTMKGDLRVTAIRLSSIDEELTELRKVVVTMARQEERILALDDRMLAQGKRVDAQGDRITSLDQRIFKLESRADRAAHKTN